ncbi:MAG: UPF0280 family protein [Desulfatibacillaceae bacterium]
MAQERAYRSLMSRGDLVSFRVVVEQTDLWCLAAKDLSRQARELVLDCRARITGVIDRHPGFAESLTPWETGGPIPSIARRMAQAGAAAGTGPMAAVAGAIAEFVGMGLMEMSADVVVENGGDAFVHVGGGPFTVAVHAGRSPLSGRIGLRLDCDGQPLAICTSSGTVGHSLSMGKADAAVVVSRDATLADAVATAMGNRVLSPGNVQTAVEFGKNVSGVLGVLVVADESMGAWGDLEIVPL